MSARMTGDIKNNVRKLQLALRKVLFEKDVDVKSITAGEPTEHLKILNHLFTKYSHGVAKLVTEMNLELRSKTDLRFLEAIYKILRELFSYHPPVTRDQFFSSSFAERKVIMSTEVAEMVYRKHRSMPKVKQTGQQPAAVQSRLSDPEMRSFDKSASMRHNTSAASVHGTKTFTQRHADGSNFRPSTVGRTRKENAAATGVKSKSATSRGVTVRPVTQTSPLNDVTNRADVTTDRHDWSSSSSTVFNEPSRIGEQEVSYSFAEPIDIVARTPPPTSTPSSGRQRTSSPIEQPIYGLVEERVTTLVDERVALTMRETILPELETLRARVLILENRNSILQATCDKLLAEKSNDDVTPSGIQATSPVVAQGSLQLDNRITTIVSRPPLGGEPTLEQELQNVVTSLIDDVMADAKCDLSDEDLNPYGTESKQAQRMYSMIEDINAAIMKTEVV